MPQFLDLAALNENQLDQYSHAISKAFPEVISKSAVIAEYWSKLEKYYPEYQQFLLSPEGDLVGFMNAVPFEYSRALEGLPEEGWDWMLTKGIEDYERGITANYLGGLQVIVRKKYQQRGYSKKIIHHCRELVKSSGLSNLVIPIRPTKKHLYPKMAMLDYQEIRKDEKIFDPWIRTHLHGGAQIIKTCERSMTIRGNVKFWEKLLGQSISVSGDYILAEALRPIKIDLENDAGEYVEPNIWIKYD